MAYFEIEPWGFAIENFRCGQIAATVANFSGCSTKHDYKATDFAPRTDRPPTLAERIKAAFESMKG